MTWWYFFTRLFVLYAWLSGVCYLDGFPGFDVVCFTCSACLCPGYLTPLLHCISFCSFPCDFCCGLLLSPAFFLDFANKYAFCNWVQYPTLTVQSGQKWIQRVATELLPVHWGAADGNCCTGRRMPTGDHHNKPVTGSSKGEATADNHRCDAACSIAAAIGIFSNPVPRRSCTVFDSTIDCRGGVNSTI